jgi:predicted RNase H-related nuclease YkuK (DUF458 family)
MKEEIITGWRKFNGEPVKDVITYLQDRIKSAKNIKIAVGCDSKQRRYNTTYATAIVIWDDDIKRGAHIIFKRESIKKVKDLYQRLYGEVERSFSLAEYLNKNLIGLKSIEPFKKNIIVHCDFNPNAKWKSNMVYSTAKSWLEGSGYITKFKPDAYASSSCADILCQ